MHMRTHTFISGDLTTICFEEWGKQSMKLSFGHIKSTDFKLFYGHFSVSNSNLKTSLTLKRIME